MAEQLSWAEVGSRIRTARSLSQLSQDEVAQALQVDRTAVMRMESGGRKVSALELSQLAAMFDVPLSYFVDSPPPRVVSRRGTTPDDADAPSRAMWRLDVALDAHARDVTFLACEELLPPPKDPESPDCELSSFADPWKAAQDVRRCMRLPDDEPLGALADVCASWGLYSLVVAQDVDGASMQLDDAPGYGAAVIGGELAPGRRRFTAAHELGHHLLQDPYSSDVGVHASRDAREGLINAFAEELLLPAAHLREVLVDETSESIRSTLLAVSARFRVSWSTAVRSATRLELVTPDVATALLARTPTRGDFLSAIGQTPKPDLEIGATSSQWKQAVLAAYQRALITGARAVELLSDDSFSVADLPERAATESTL